MEYQYRKFISIRNWKTILWTNFYIWIDWK